MTDDRPEDDEADKTDDDRVSLAPLDPEDALRALLAVDPTMEDEDETPDPERRGRRK